MSLKVNGSNVHQGCHVVPVWDTAKWESCNQILCMKSRIVTAHNLRLTLYLSNVAHDFATMLEEILQTCTYSSYNAIICSNDCCAKRSLLSAEETPWLWAAVLNFGDMVCFKLIEISSGNRSMDLEFGRRFQLIQPFCFCNFATHTAILATWFCFGTLVNAVAFLSAFRIAGSCVKFAALHRTCQAVLLLLKNGQVVIKKIVDWCFVSILFSIHPSLTRRSTQSLSRALPLLPPVTNVSHIQWNHGCCWFVDWICWTNAGNVDAKKSWWRSPLPQGGPRCSALVSGACEKCWNAMAKDEILERSLRSQIYKNTNEIKIIDIQIYRSSKCTRIVLPRCKSAVQRHSTRLLALRCTGSASSRRYSVFQEESSVSGLKFWSAAKRWMKWRQWTMNLVLDTIFNLQAKKLWYKQKFHLPSYFKQVSKLSMFWSPRFLIRFAVGIQHINASWIWNKSWGPFHHANPSQTNSSKAQLVSSKSTCKCMCTPSRKPSRDVLTLFESMRRWFISGIEKRKSYSKTWKMVPEFQIPLLKQLRTLLKVQDFQCLWQNKSAMKQGKRND